MGWASCDCKALGLELPLQLVRPSKLSCSLTLTRVNLRRTYLATRWSSSAVRRQSFKLFTSTIPKSSRRSPLMRHRGRLQCVVARMSSCTNRGVSRARHPRCAHQELPSLEFTLQMTMSHGKYKRMTDIGILFSGLSLTLSAPTMTSRPVPYRGVPRMSY